LLKNSANVNAQTNAGHTPLHAAAYEGQVETAGVLLAHGTNVHALSRGGWSALDVATLQRQNRVADMLLAASNGTCQGPHVAPSEEGLSLQSSEVIYQIDDGRITEPWPWSLGDSRLKNIGEVNVTFKLLRSAYASRVFPLHALPVLELEEASVVMSPYVQATGLHTAPILDDAARSVLLQVERLRREITLPMLKSSSVSFWAAHFPLSTLADKVQGLKEDTVSTHALLLRDMLGTFDRFTHEVKSAVAPAIGCVAELLACPRFGGYQRIEQDHFLSW
jgi:hypothetical protein